MKKVIKYGVGSKVTNKNGTSLTVVGEGSGFRTLNVDGTPYIFDIATSRISTRRRS